MDSTYLQGQPILSGLYKITGL